MKRIPITKANLLNNLNDNELLDGYIDGRNNEPEPGGNRSYSYWHGWLNGMMDAGHMKHDSASRSLAKDVIETKYLQQIKQKYESNHNKK